MDWIVALKDGSAHRFAQAEAALIQGTLWIKFANGSELIFAQGEWLQASTDGPARSVPPAPRLSDAFAAHPDWQVGEDSDEEQHDEATDGATA